MKRPRRPHNGNGQHDSGPEARYVFRLFVAGATERSRQALLVIRELCETRLAGRYDLQVIDVHQQPELAQEDHVVVTPALVRVAPGPVLRVFGDLRDARVVSLGLDLPPANGGRSASGS